MAAEAMAGAVVRSVLVTTGAEGLVVEFNHERSRDARATARARREDGTGEGEADDGEG